MLTAPRACIEENPTSRHIKFGGAYINMNMLSRAQNVSQAHVCRVLNGLRTPSMPVALKIASGLGLTIDELLANIEHKRAERDAADDAIIEKHQARLRREAMEDKAAERAGRVPTPRLLGRRAS